MTAFRSLMGALALALVSLAAPPAHAQDAARPEAMVGFFAVRAATAHPVQRHAASVGGRDHAAVRSMIGSEVCAQIGCQWTSTALRIAQIESRFNCSARNGRAVGVFQNTNPAMFGVSRAAALTCSGGVRAGVAHMRMCLAKGARSSAQMMRCHNSGSPFGRVERAYRIALRG